METIDFDKYRTELNSAAPHPPYIEGVTTNARVEDIWKALNQFAKRQHFGFLLKERRTRPTDTGSKSISMSMRCSHAGCKYQVRINVPGKYDDEGDEEGVLYYKRTAMVRHNHATDGSEDMSSSIDRAEKDRLSKRSESLPPRTPQPSQAALWKMINEWADKFAFAFKAPNCYTKKNKSTFTARFKCCRTNDEQEACPFYINALVDDSVWRVSNNRRKSEAHNHNHSTEGPVTNEEQLNRITDIEIQLSRILEPPLCPEFLPPMKSFLTLIDLERYLSEFSLNYIPEGSDEIFYFGWIRTSNHWRQSKTKILTDTKRVYYACYCCKSKVQGVPDCPISVYAYKDNAGTWYLRHPHEATTWKGHTHPSAASKWDVWAHRHLTIWDASGIRYLNAQNRTPEYIAREMRRAGFEGYTDSQLLNVINIEIGDDIRKETSIIDMVKSFRKQKVWEIKLMDYIDESDHDKHCMLLLGFSHLRSLQYAKKYPHTLILDCTYKDDETDIVLMEAVGIDGDGRPFSIAFMFMHTDGSMHVALQWLWDLYDKHGIERPTVIVSDIFTSSALDTTLEDTPRRPVQIVCSHHLDQALDRCASLDLTPEEHRTFMSEFRGLMASPTCEQFELDIQNFKHKYEHFDFFKKVWTNLIDPSSSSLCDRIFPVLYEQTMIPHFTSTTSTGEGLYYFLKSYIKPDTETIPEAMLMIERALEQQFQLLERAHREMMSLDFSSIFNHYPVLEKVYKRLTLAALTYLAQQAEHGECEHLDTVPRWKRQEAQHNSSAPDVSTLNPSDSEEFVVRDTGGILNSLGLSPIDQTNEVVVSDHSSNAMLPMVHKMRCPSFHRLGLPCGHYLRILLKRRAQLELQDVNKHWMRLEDDDGVFEPLPLDEAEFLAFQCEDDGTLLTEIPGESWRTITFPRYTIKCKKNIDNDKSGMESDDDVNDSLMSL